MLKRSLTYQYKTLIFGILFITSSLNAVRFSKEAYQEQRDWKIASNAIIARDYLNKLCQTSAALSRVNEELNNESPSKRVYSAIIKRLDFLSEGLGTILDSDNLVSGLIPRDKAEETSFNRTINTHHYILRDLVAKATHEYPVLVSLAKKQIESDNMQQECMRFDHATKADLISPKARGDFQAKMDRYNSAHKALHKGLQELSDSLHLRKLLDQASEYLHIESKVKYNDLHSLFLRLEAQSNKIKESAQDCFLSAKRTAEAIQEKNKNIVKKPAATQNEGQKILEAQNEMKILSAIRDASVLEEQLFDIQQRTIVPRLVTRKLLCPASLSVFEYNNKALSHLPLGGTVDVEIEVILTGGRPGTIRKLVFVTDTNAMAIKPALVTIVDQLRFKLEDLGDIEIPFTSDRSVYQIAQAETGDCYLSSNRADFYKVSEVIGLIETNEK